jgi:hypothetical protein
MDIPILDLTLPPQYDHPPPFPSLNYDLPTYARTAAADERILISSPVVPQRCATSSTVPTEYAYETKRLRLNLGPRTSHIKVPCYGWNATVEGYLDVSDFARAQAVKLTVAVSDQKLTYLNLIDRLFIARGICYVNRHQSGNEPLYIGSGSLIHPQHDMEAPRSITCPNPFPLFFPTALFYKGDKDSTTSKLCDGDARFGS